MQRFGRQPKLCRASQQAPLHHTKGTASCPLASACGLASIYDYVHFASRSDVSVPVFVPQITIPVCMPYMKPFFFFTIVGLVEA
ncbi:hypothetical protein PSPO01_16097 [Paraphaeosphaeria sporulosa]